MHVRMNTCMGETSNQGRSYMYINIKMRSPSFINLRYTVVGFIALVSCALLIVLGRNAPLSSDSIIWKRSPESSRLSPQQLKERSLLGTIDDKGLVIPDDRDLESLNETQMAQLYWRYMNNIQTLCRHQARIGSMKDGGKEICLDPDYFPRKPCLVYSFGSNYQCDFERAVIHALGCEVHTFDPSLDLKQNNTKGKLLPAKINFQLKGLAGHNHVTSDKWEMRTLDTIMRELGHENRTLDILKIDIEGGEWHALPQMLKAGTLRHVKQLSIEIHYGPKYVGRPNWVNVECRDQLRVLRDLREEGFLIFMRERNLNSVRKFLSKYNAMYTTVNEISLINTKYQTSHRARDVSVIVL